MGDYDFYFWLYKNNINCTPHPPPYLCQIKPSGMEGIYFKGNISAFWNTILKASCFQAGWRRWVVRNEETARSQWKLQINRASLAFLASLPYGYVVPGTTGWYGVPLWIGLGLQPHLSPFAPLNFPLLLGRCLPWQGQQSLHGRGIRPDTTPKGKRLWGTEPCQARKEPSVFTQGEQQLTLHVVPSCGIKYSLVTWVQHPKQISVAWANTDGRARFL